MPSHSDENHDRLAQLRQAWAGDDDTRLDFCILAEDVLSSLRAPENPLLFWVRHFRAMSSASFEEIEAMDPPSDALRIQLDHWLASAQGGGLKSARRRWPQALALAGAIDFGPKKNDLEAGFNQAAGLAGAWLWSFHPDFGSNASSNRNPAAKKMIEQARVDLAEIAIASLFDFGDQLGIENATDKAMKVIELETQMLGKHGVGAYELLARRKPEVLIRLLTQVERAALSRVAAPAVSNSKPRL